MVRDFHKVIGREARAQIIKAEGKLPKTIVACVGGNRIRSGSFTSSLKTRKYSSSGWRLVGAAGIWVNMPRALSGGSPGVLQGTYSYVLQDDAGQIAAYSFRLGGS